MKKKASFTLARPDAEEEEEEVVDDDDDWISTESASGAATPNQGNDSDTGSTSSEFSANAPPRLTGGTPVDDALLHRLQVAAVANATSPPNIGARNLSSETLNQVHSQQVPSSLAHNEVANPRVPTPHLADEIVASDDTNNSRRSPAAKDSHVVAFSLAASQNIQRVPKSNGTPPSIPFNEAEPTQLHNQSNQPAQPHHQQVDSVNPFSQPELAGLVPPSHKSYPAIVMGTMPRPANTSTNGTASAGISGLPNGISQKRSAAPRPASMHSASGRSEHGSLRLHPLIRGQSSGGGSALQPPRPMPLAALTILNDDSQRSSNSGSPPPLSTSPSSVRTLITSPTSPEAPQSAGNNPNRRTSVSSTRSVSTLPGTTVYHSLSGVSAHDVRHRTMSSTSSSAAISSLAHLPAITRPPSPQMISFFPPPKPNFNIETIHPLLPPPYLINHLTVVAKRSPLRDSYERVMKARHDAARAGV